MTAHPPPSSPSLPPVSDRFLRILDLLSRVLAIASLRGVPGPLVGLIAQRLGRIRTRFAALAAKIQAGTVRPPRPQGRRRAPSPGAPSRPRPADPLPRTRAWLLRLLGYHAAGYAQSLQQMMAEPEMAALIAAAPQMRRLLRPLLSILTNDRMPAVLRLPRPRPKRVAARGVALPRAAARAAAPGRASRGFGPGRGAGAVPRGGPPLGPRSPSRIDALFAGLRPVPLVAPALFGLNFPT